MTYFLFSSLVFFSMDTLDDGLSIHLVVIPLANSAILHCRKMLQYYYINLF